MTKVYEPGQLCSIEDCKKPVKQRGWCGMHYERWRRHGDPMIVRTTRGNRTHGMAGSPEFSSWTHMKRRCLNPNDRAYRRYGGRGITIYGPWITSFEAFYEYMGPMPGPGYSIDRYPDNDGNYEPGNVRWATDAEQAGNQKHHGGRRKQTHCRQGHKLTPANTYVSKRGARRCRRCMNAHQRAKRARLRAESPLPERTHCKHGHKYTPENTRLSAKGTRVCRQCVRDRSNAYKRRQKHTGER